jgi:glucan phosphoethanolaminetransferase (alkaline phosphatase superfamily)
MKPIRIYGLFFYLLYIAFTLNVAISGDPHGFLLLGMITFSALILLLTIILRVFKVFSTKESLIYGVMVFILITLVYTYRDSEHYAKRYPELTRNRMHTSE